VKLINCSLIGAWAKDITLIILTFSNSFLRKHNARFTQSRVNVKNSSGKMTWPSVGQLTWLFVGDLVAVCRSTVS